MTVVGTSGTPRVLLESDSDLPIVHVSVSTLAGASRDPAGREGLSRICARLMRRTAGGRSLVEIDAHVDRMGATLGVECGHESLSLSGSVLTRSFEEYLSLLEEAILEPGLEDGELERLERETLAELDEILDSDQHLVLRWFYRTLFTDHPYGRSVIGNASSLSRIGPGDVASCWKDRFRGDDLLFAFAGDADERQCRDFCQRLQSRLPRAASPGASVGEPRRRPGRELVFVDKPDRAQTQIIIGGLGSHPRDADHFPLLVANTVFGGTFSSRLTHEVRAKRGWSYGAHSSLGYDRKRQAFSLWTFPKAADAAACIALELELLDQWWQAGITQQELEAAKSYLVRSRAFALDTTSKRIGLLMDEVLSDLPPGHHRQYVERVENVTLDQAQAAIRSRVSLDDLTCAVLGTHADIGEAVRDAIPNLKHHRVVPFDAD